MAKAYRAKRDVSFAKPIAQINEREWSSEGQNYVAGSLIPADHLMPFVREKAENGEYDHLLEPLSDEDYESVKGVEQAGEPEHGIFVAEHEAEAHALRDAGHIVIPKSQVLESLSAGAEHSAQYQAAAREAGLDRRPAQEHMAGAESDEGRIPDEYLKGMETRTGLPHDRGMSHRDRQNLETGDSNEDDSSSAESESDGQSQAARPRPPEQSSEQPSDQGQVQSEQQSEGNQ